MVRRIAGAVLVASAVALHGCTPTFPDTSAIVSGPRLLAVQAIPAEAAVGKSFAMTALYVGPEGAQDPSGVDWAICLLQKPLGDPDPIARGCFADASSGLAPLGAGGAIAASVPANACELFGPESPPPLAGQPSARPTDPDPTGGFYLPVTVKSAGDEWSAALERIACSPSGLTQSVFSAFSSGYVPNENPAVGSLARVDASGGSSALPQDGASAASSPAFTAGARVQLRVGWATCASSPGACSGAETYLYVDPTSKQLATGRESIVASWYATAGAFDLDRVGRDGSDMGTSVDDGWTAPVTPGTVHLWVVLRDARGGVGWGSYTVEVK